MKGNCRIVLFELSSTKARLDEASATLISSIPPKYFCAKASMIPRAARINIITFWQNNHQKHKIWNEELINSDIWRSWFARAFWLLWAWEIRERNLTAHDTDIVIIAADIDMRGLSCFKCVCICFCTQERHWVKVSFPAYQNIQSSRPSYTANSTHVRVRRLTFW